MHGRLLVYTRALGVSSSGEYGENGTADWPLHVITRTTCDMDKVHVPHLLLIGIDTIEIFDYSLQYRVF